MAPASSTTRTLLRQAIPCCLALLGLAVFTSCGSSCPFGLLDRKPFGGVVECCGASASRDLDLLMDLEVDIAHIATPGQAAQLDVWLTTADCTKLFEGSYPPPGGASAARCRVLLGPVAPGAVSTRTKLSKGRYRLFVQAASSNAAAGEYLFDVGLWGEKCGATPGL